ncbi:uncharacterized protein PF3D7_1120000 [Microplitis demolitor]|uniref:uncharacterized protein PF3D7_1120000 n=1 Tax=Microplitis demolitor TaxID=69319 RepID=UPI00235B6AAE|nr:uncharacterized protein PF3D7_1120000 [Microplitis demolitor]
MIFQAVLIFFILQVGQELILADDFLDRNDFENFIQKKNENKVESPTNSMEQVIPRIEMVMENYSNKIVTHVDKSFEAELKSMIKDLKIFSNKSFNSTTEYLKKLIKREVESVKIIVKTVYRVLEAEKENFQDEITRGLRNMSRAKVEIVKNILKDELDQSARAELNELKISVKDELKKFARTELDYFKKNLKNEIVESSKNDVSSLKTFIITQLSLLKSAMENSYIRNSKKSTCELTKSAIETIKNMTEKSDSPIDDDSNLEQHMSKLEDKFERVLLRLEFKNSTCKFDDQTKSTFESLKSVSEKLNHPDHNNNNNNNNNNNEVCQKFEKLGDELSKNLTIGLNRVNIKLSSMKKSVSGKVIASSKSIESTVRDALTGELDKFSKTQLKATKTAINDTLAGILETELESLKSTFKNQLKEQVGIFKDKFNELVIKPETLATQLSIESLNSTINQIQNKLSKELDKSTNDILNAINKTLTGYVKNDTLIITSKEGKSDEKIKTDGDILATTPKDDSIGLNKTLPIEKEEIAKEGTKGSSKTESGDSDGGVSVYTSTEKTDKDGEETPVEDVDVSSTTEETVEDGEETPVEDVDVSSTTEETVEDGEETPVEDVDVSSATEETVEGGEE